MSALATVVGGAGFIGSRLVAHLRSQGWDCRAPARDDREFWRHPLGTVFYCAGLTADFATRPHDTVAAHVELLNQLLGQSRFDALVYLSSTRLYDHRVDGGTTALDEAAPLALDPAHPRHLFDLSKALGESLCRHASGGRARVARLSCVYEGADDPDGFLGSLLRQLRPPRAPHDAAPLDVDSTAHAARDYVCMDDVLDALVLIASRGTQPVYNVASGANVSNARLFERLGVLAGREVRALRSHPLPNPPAVSIARMRGEFGWQPVHLLDRLPRLVQEAQGC